MRNDGDKVVEPNAWRNIFWPYIWEKNTKKYMEVAARNCPAVLAMNDGPHDPKCPVLGILSIFRPGERFCRQISAAIQPINPQVNGTFRRIIVHHKPAAKSKRATFFPALMYCHQHLPLTAANAIELVLKWKQNPALGQIGKQCEVA